MDKTRQRRGSDTAGLLRVNGRPHGKVYSYMVDTLATISFWTPTAMAQEVLVAGLTVEQSLKVRGASVLINLPVARPYGLFRDWAFKMLRTGSESSQLRRYLSDYVTFGVFWTPLYIAMLACAGSDMHQTVKAVGMGLVTNLVTGRPYGAFLDLVRRMAGLKASWQQDSKEVLPPAQDEGRKDKYIAGEKHRC